MEDVQGLRLQDVKPPPDVSVETAKNGHIHKSVSIDRDTQVYDDNEKVTVEDKCGQLERSCTSCCVPCLASHNPLPKDAKIIQKLKHSLMLPPHGNLASYIQFAVVCFQIWIVLYTLTNDEALPGGNFFSLLVLFVCCAVGGYLISFVHLPPLLGMLIVGLLLRNVPVIKTVGQNISPSWSGALRKIALTVILTRGGLGLDIVKLRKLSWAVLRLAWLPCLGEIITAGIVSKYLLGFPWFWSLMLGCIMGALSPAVTVPSLVSLQERCYGVDKGIPTMLLAAGGLDNVLCLTGFSVFFGIIFSDGDLVMTIFKGPIGVFVGIVYGLIVGIFLWYIPSKDSSNRVFYRSVMLLCSGLIAIFGSSKIGLSGAGPLGCLTSATVAAYKWRKERQLGETTSIDEISGVMALTWLIVQHFLFGLIGSAVDVDNIQSNVAGLGIATLLIGLVVRSIISFSVTLGIGFNMKERVFVTLTWLAKATVQAAVGGMALDAVRSLQDPAPDDLKYATDVLTISVLAILICAPTGATLMAVLGPRYLKHEVPQSEVRAIDDQKFKTELSLTLKNRCSKLFENKAIVNHVDEQVVSDSGKHGGLENPAFTEEENETTADDIKCDKSNAIEKNYTENVESNSEKQETGDETTSKSIDNGPQTLNCAKNGEQKEAEIIIDTTEESVDKIESTITEDKYRTVVEVPALK